MTLDEFIKEAEKNGIHFGKNPNRTIRYYVSTGLLEPPEINYKGKVKQSSYSENHLLKLKMISKYKKEGHTLAAINEMTKGNVYWSDEALQFMNPIIIAKNYPLDAFSKDKPITRAAFAAFINNCIEEGRLSRDFLERFFVDKEGTPISFVL